MSDAITMRDLQRISAEKIQALRHPTPVTSGGKIIATLVPQSDRLAQLQWLAERAADLAKRRSPEEKARIVALLGYDPD